jgi:hypothetical protein
MKKLLLVLAFVTGVAHTSSAQSDYSVVSTFVNSAISQDAESMLNVMHPDNYDDIDDVMRRSQIFDFQCWELVGVINTEYGARYIVAMYPSEEALLSGVLSDDKQRLYVTPSGAIFCYEVLYVVNEGGRKYIVCNGDLMTIGETEQALRTVGKSVPSKYYVDRYGGGK